MRVVVWLLLFVAFQAHAELVQYGTYIRDTATGLEWMNTSLTLGDSYLQANSSSPDWRHATRREVDALARRYIGSTEGSYLGGQDFNQTLRVIALLGITYETLGDTSVPVTFAVLAFYNDGLVSDGVGLAEFQVKLFVPTDPADPIYPDLFVSRWISLDNAFSTTTSASNIANLMVRRR